ncbi:RNase H domain-containing protein [Trichonephila clavipes]|nr:RNase H domain-containing protein [Trichonephila clavipes]
MRYKLRYCPRYFTAKEGSSQSGDPHAACIATCGTGSRIGHGHEFGHPAKSDFVPKAKLYVPGVRQTLGPLESWGPPRCGDDAMPLHQDSKSPYFPSGAPHSKNPPKNTCFELELLQPCSKKEDPVTLRQKGLETIAILSQDNFAIAYTDGSSDRSLSNGGAGIILLLPDGNNYKHKINTGIIASNFTSELGAIREALLLYQQNPHVIDSTEGLVIFSDSKSAIEAIRNGETNISCDIITLLEQLHNKRKSCILQWIPAHVNIEGNEGADSLAKEARDIEHKCTTITLDDANAVAKHRIMNHTFKKPLVTEFDCPRIITSTIARLRTEHLKGMKIHPDKTRSYVQCKHCPDLQLTPNHILECPTVATKLLKMGMVPLRDSLRELLYSPDAPRIAEAVIKTFDGI